MKTFNLEDKELEECRYCGGNCPNELEDSEFLCDGFAGDIDKLYSKNKS
mgnify:CR=1 FL=1